MIRAADAFQAFRQVDGAHARRYKVTGLGPGIVLRLVRSMRGTMAVDSELGQGTAVHFTVECGRPLRILLAEDEAINQLAVSRYLEKAGHAVTCAGDGRQALEALKAGDFDLVLMDIQMPEMDGLEAVRAIRSGAVPGADPRLPVIALTAHAMAEDCKAFTAAGMDACISKPVDMAALEALLRSMTRPKGPA